MLNFDIIFISDIIFLGFGPQLIELLDIWSITEEEFVIQTLQLVIATGIIWIWLLSLEDRDNFIKKLGRALRHGARARIEGDDEV